MKIKNILTLLSVVILGACSSTSNTLFGDDKKPETKQAKQTVAFDGTFMKNKIANFKSEQEQLKTVVDSRKNTLQQMRNETNTAVSDYRSAISQINSKLQLGTTPGNPELMDEWKDARAKLEKINNIAFDIKRLVADVESDQSMVDYMVGSIQASYKIRGATEDDHKQLKTLEEEAKQIGSNISIFARQLNQEAERQQAYVDNEKYSLNDVALNIKNGKLYGSSSSTDFFANGGSMFSSDESYEAFINETAQDYGMQSRTSNRPAPRSPMMVENRDTVALRPARATSTPVDIAPIAKSTRPIITVKFDKTSVDFAEPLYQSLSRVLERNPSATFEVSGVAPQGKSNGTIKKNVKDVMTTLTEMGLPASRVALTMRTDDVMFDEVRIYEK